MDYKVKKIAEMGRLSEAEFHEAKKRPIVVVLDNVRSQYNVGSVFRTADAFLIEAVYLCGICPTPENIEVHKTALGAEKTVDYTYYNNTREAIDALHERGYMVYAIEQCHNSQTLADFITSDSITSAQRITSDSITSAATSSPRGIAVVFGHEVFGVSQDIVDQCDGCIEIPQFGTKHSLNVSTTAGIVLYELSTHIA